ncbi:hypothetical protein KVA01_19130 [Kocuria varians]|uniref:Uncharacterized protein n=1 Tax=Kocuria varians TaxID=1272 RepID=A0A4Y4D3J5_KOCVA|nr:hypothetical protein KVA01_19130 [Kocuria varians]
MKTASWFPHVLSASVLTLTVSLCLVSCGDSADHADPAVVSASPSTADGSLHPGTFRAMLPGGASVRITLPAVGTPDEAIDRLRQDAKVGRATYATVEIDNRKGRSPISVSRLVLKMQDGASYQLEHVSRAVEKWTPKATQGTYHARDGSTMTEGAARKLSSRLRDAGARATGDVAVGHRNTNLLVGDISRVPQNFVSLELIPKIGDREVPPVQAHPEGQKSSSSESGAGGSSRGTAEDAVPDSTAIPEDPEGPVDPGDPTPAPSADHPAVDPPDPVVPVDPDPVVPNPVPTNPVVPDPVVPTDPVPPDPVVPEPGDPGTPAPATTGVAGPDPEVPAPVVTDVQSSLPVEPTAPAVESPLPGAVEAGSLAALPSETGTPVPGLMTQAMPLPLVETAEDQISSSASPASIERRTDRTGTAEQALAPEPTGTPAPPLETRATRSPAGLRTDPSDWATPVSVIKDARN